MRMNDISFLGKCHDNNSHVRDDYPISKEEQHKDQLTGSVKAKFYMICNVNLMIKMAITIKLFEMYLSLPAITRQFEGQRSAMFS